MFDVKQTSKTVLMCEIILAETDRTYNWPGSLLISVQIPHVLLLVSVRGCFLCQMQRWLVVSPVTLQPLVNVELLHKMLCGSWLCIIRNSYQTLCSRQLTTSLHVIHLLIIYIMVFKHASVSTHSTASICSLFLEWVVAVLYNKLLLYLSGWFFLLINSIAGVPVQKFWLRPNL